MPKIKALKVDREVKVKKKGEKNKRWMQWSFLFVLIMILIGFILGGINDGFGGSDNTANTPQITYPSYYLTASKTGSEAAIVSEVGDKYAVLSTGRTPTVLINRFDGEIIELEGVAPFLNIGDYSDIISIQDAAGDSAIIYKTASCSGATNYTCMVNLNTTVGEDLVFDVYRLSNRSNFIIGDSFGLLSSG